MVQPESLKSDQYQPWSRGRGVDVWAMLRASITGDLATIKKFYGVKGRLPIGVAP